jgi:aspartate 1-decarboxylase
MSETSAGTIAVIRAKLHDLRVTDADLDYQGSITLDPEHCEAVGILPLEFVEVWNKNSGARITTYVIWGRRGSRCCILNGAAARTCQKGDRVIIVARTSVHPEAITTQRPRVALFNADNGVGKVVEYRVRRGRDGRLSFSTVTAGKLAARRRRRRG